jgi:hypothetical protein
LAIVDVVNPRHAFPGAKYVILLLDNILLGTGVGDVMKVKHRFDEPVHEGVHQHSYVLPRLCLFSIRQALGVR